VKNVCGKPFSHDVNDVDFVALNESYA